ncbi:signal peptidase I [Pedosphaera parvula]|uniref:Signal peptidase I n=1 Tax=Pedosphaera parvula (strain Ellin514) TaxID=320771 RepID=B9XFZ9_PEDPL|nr:signal peptidase I [Pedosphaera parvula]EEF61161.1 signal peptidase I [Pedosphaera parvula Ellin514]
MDGETKSTGVLHWLKVIVVGRNPKRTAIRLAILIIGSFIIFGYVLFPVRISGISMNPTYENGKVNFINRLAYVWREPRRGDIVGIRYSGKHLMLMKRIVALPGETVSFSRGVLQINGQPMPESYVKLRSKLWDSEGDPESCKVTTLKEDEYYVVGDNREMAPRDHDHGIAERNRIVGKALL